MTHVTEDIQAYLDGELPESRAEQVRRHLDGCTECRARLDADRLLWQAVDVAGALRLTTSLWPGVAAGLDRRRQRRWTWSQRSLAAAALAAGVVLGLGFGRQTDAVETDVVIGDELDYLQDGLPSLDQLWIELGDRDEDVGS